MGRERQKKKNRSSVSKIKPKLQGRTKAGKKKVNFLGNEIIAQNWDRKLTVSQNYDRLGLSAKLNDPVGGKQRKPSSHFEDGDIQDHMRPREAPVERDPATGRILRVIQPVGEVERRDALQRLNPLNDPLSNLERTGEDSQRKTTSENQVVAQLEAQAAEEIEQLARTKRPRQQSKREEDWIAKLVARHGDNVTAMVRDRKLNPMQQTEGDIRRRLELWHRKNPHVVDVTV